jgi:hypothetical protein
MIAAARERGVDDRIFHEDYRFLKAKAFGDQRAK